MSFMSELFASADARFHALGGAAKALFLKIEGDIAGAHSRIAELENGVVALEQEVAELKIWRVAMSTPAESPPPQPAPSSPGFDKAASAAAKKALADAPKAPVDTSNA